MPVNVLLHLVFVLISVHTCLQDSVEVAEEAVVAELYVELFDDVLNNKELAVLDCLFECLLDVPEHEVLHLGILCKDLLEAVEVSLYRRIDH